MPEQMTIAPANIADQLDITIITLRRWCAAYAAHLSPLANPDPGQARRFTYRDREVLKHVKTLRDQGRSLGDIADLLVDLTFPEIDTGQNDSALTIVEAPDAHQETPANALMVSTLDAMQRRIDALEQAKPTPVASHSRMADVVLGVLLALGFMVVILLLAVLYGK